MKRILLIIIVLVAASAASLTAFFIAKDKQDKIAESEASKLADYSLFSFDSSTVNKITISVGDEDYVAELNSESEWELTSTDEFEANSDYFLNVCTYLSTLTAEKDFGEADDEKKAMYGLDNPITITAADGTNEYTVHIGNPSPTGDVYYIMTGNKSKIYAIDTLYGSVLKTSVTMMKDPMLLPFGDREIARIELIRDGNTVYDLNYNEESGQWYLPEQYGNLTTDMTKITSMINIMTRIEAQSFYDDHLEDLSKYGFDKPAAELIVTGLNGVTRKYLFSLYGNETDTYIYVLFEETGQVAAYYTGDCHFINYDYSQFISPGICGISLNGITGLDFTFEGRSDSFEVDSESNTVKMNGTALSDFAANTTNSFSTFYSALNALELSGLDIDAEPEASEPILKAVFKFADEPDKTLELTKRDDSTSYIFIDGEYTGAYIDNEKFTGKNTLDFFYDSFLVDVEG